MTTPTWDALRALVQKWREMAEQHKTHGDCYRKGQGWGMEDCSKELEAVLSAALASVSVVTPERRAQLVELANKQLDPPCEMPDGMACDVCTLASAVLEFLQVPPHPPETPRTVETTQA